MRKTAKSPSEKIISDIKRAACKHYLSGEKIRIVLDDLRAIAEGAYPNGKKALSGRLAQLRAGAIGTSTASWQFCKPRSERHAGGVHVRQGAGHRTVWAGRNVQTEARIFQCAAALNVSRARHFLLEPPSHLRVYVYF
jgi:hypothetical protein